MKGSSSSSGLLGMDRKKEEDLRRGEVGLLKRPIVARAVERLAQILVLECGLKMRLERTLGACVGWVSTERVGTRLWASLVGCLVVIWENHGRRAWFWTTLALFANVWGPLADLEG